MSADEFDPMIERLFARTTPLADEALFLAVFQARESFDARGDDVGGNALR